MNDKHDRLMHGRVVQHASVRREKSQQVMKASGPFGHAEPSISGARVSPHVTSSSFFCRRHDSPSDASLPHPPAGVIFYHLFQKLVCSKMHLRKLETFK